MNKRALQDDFEQMSPAGEQIERMRERIAKAAPDASVGRGASGRRQWWAVPAACVALMLALFALLPFGGQNAAYAIHVQVGEDNTLFRLENRNGGSDNAGTSISKVDSRPGLAFYIEGDNIARIDITAENEYLAAKDWTRTQHEKYWNVEYYQTFDEERQISIANLDLLYDKTMTMTFDENFDAYGDITYKWDARNLYEWAAENHFSRFIGYKEMTEDLTEEERLRLAAAQDTAAGHIDLTGYPEHLLEDTITITITDRDGKQTKQAIHVKISSNELQQTVVTAELVEA